MPAPEVSVSFYCVFPDGPRGKRKTTFRTVKLPRAHALIFARFAYHGGTPECPFSLPEWWFKQQSQDDQNYIAEDPPHEYNQTLPGHVFKDGKVVKEKPVRK